MFERPEGLNPMDGKYYDVFGNELQVGDVCLRIVGYNHLTVEIVRSMGECLVTFVDGNHSRFDLVVSLNALGIEKSCDQDSDGGALDVLGHSLHVGDRVLFICSSMAAFTTGSIKSIAKVKCTIEHDPSNYSGATKSIRSFDDVLNLSTYRLDNLKEKPPYWSVRGTEF